MNYKLKDVNGNVNFLLRAGKDFVKNQMSAASAQHIIKHGTVKESDKDGYPINVDDKWFFEGEVVSNQVPEEETAGETEGE